ncbi:hypothetical protein B0H67DRAFT_637003 [Lasiosphaeris hirsuta]|uniref:D-arabinono-1,4-lactone oxidase n=1 Tax=Lasiosphaeris hirsuta TaxID=260670 RepID=A0AA40A3K7_9PEZI|nr:hypothetical protein B0H67DRAFT_637003 [Lasiosphaeris hirsuta]
MDEVNKVDPNEAIELFIWALEKPDDEDKKRQLVAAFEEDPETVLNAAPADAVPTWRNCIDEQPCVPLKYRCPKSLKELVGIVGEARDKKAPVRAIGSGHSFSDITNAQDAILVKPQKWLKQVFSVDASILHHVSDPANTIRAQCGITYGPMADFVLSIVLVTESGKVYQIEPSPSSTAQPITDPAKFPGHLPEAPDVLVELKQDDDWFRAAKVAMGCLGIIYSYTMRVQKAFSLSEVRTLTTWEEMKPLLSPSSSSSWPPPILQNTDHFELLINPYAQGDSTHECIQVKRTREELTAPRGARLTGISKWLEVIGVKSSAALVVLLNTAPGLLNRVVISGALGFLQDMDPPYVDVSHTVFTLGIENTMKAWAVELHVDAAEDCVDAIDKVLAAFKSLGKEKKWYIAGPLGIRFIKSSDAFLAPQAGRFTVAIELDMLYGIHHDRDLLGKVKEVVCTTVGGLGNHSVRLHWGLDWGFTTSDDVRKWYPDLGKWQAVYRELNKTGMFDNAFTNRLRLSE